MLLFCSKPGESGRCRRIQMSDEVMSLSRCSDSAVFLLKRFFSAFSFSTCNYRFFCWLNRRNCCAIPPSLCILVSQYAPLSLRPLTCEVKAGHRWGPREQGCIQFQRPETRGAFCEEKYNIMNILLPRKYLMSCQSRHSFHCKKNPQPITMSRRMYLSLQLVFYWSCHDQDLSCWTRRRRRRRRPLLLQHTHTHTLRGPTLLAGFVLWSSMGDQ